MRLFDQITDHGIFRRNMTPQAFSDAKADFEKQYLDQLLRFVRGNVKMAAEIAGRDRKGLYVLMEKHGIRPAQYRYGQKC
ncbi:hypothetical protein K8T06_15045 [bacterium]|nr:hypothetical protein [bacterium]